MSRCCVYEMPDGSVSIVYPAPKGRRREPSRLLDHRGQPIEALVEPEDEWFARTMAKTEAASVQAAEQAEALAAAHPGRVDLDQAALRARNAVLQGRPFLDCDTADLPTDRSRRDQWRVQDGRVVVDLSAPRRVQP